MHIRKLRRNTSAEFYKSRYEIYFIEQAVTNVQLDCKYMKGNILNFKRITFLPPRNWKIIVHISGN